MSLALAMEGRTRVGVAWRSGWAEFAALLALAAAVHALVTLLVYPGFYDPLWPNHADYYIPTDLARRPDAFQELAASPRPVSYAYIYLVGRFGVHISILCNLLVVFSNCALTAIFVRRFLKCKAGFSFFLGSALYFFLIFSHPLQYVWSTYDNFSQVAYLFMALGLLLAAMGASFAILAVLFSVSFLAKETYILSLLMVLGAWWATGDQGGRAAARRAGFAAVLGFTISVAYSKLVGSVYLGAGATKGSPYEVVATPASVISEWTAYLWEGLSLPMLLYVGLITVAVLAVCWRSGRGPAIAISSLSIGGLLAFLPNSLLPNHHMAGYAWNGAYLLFAPLLVLCLMTQGAPARRRLAIWTLAAASLLTPLAAKPAYAKNAWTLEQQA